MKLGILVTTKDGAGHLAGITAEACKRGHEVMVFVMDEAVAALGGPEMAGAASMQGLSFSYCDLNASQRGIDSSALPGAMARGSQYDNARMFDWADKVIRI